MTAVVARRAPKADRSPSDSHRLARRLETAAVTALLLSAILGSIAIHRLVPWIPITYLAALIVVPFTAWVIARRAMWPRRWKWPVEAVLGLTFIALLPVPWMRATLEDPPGTAWQLDGRLTINGVTVDPPGAWYWLTAGRPPIVAEIVLGWFRPNDAAATSMLGGRRAHRPAVTEPAAAAVGLRRAGWQIGMEVLVEVSDPVAGDVPSRATLSTVNGHAVTTRASWEAASARLGAQNTFGDPTGGTWEFAGAVMPYRRVDVIDTPRGALEVTVGGSLARTLPGSWFRQLSLGPSHGLMVALVSYAYASGQDLAAGRTIAGTGKIRGDGRVGSVGGLWAKAIAAREVGADMLVFPASQERLLDGFDSHSMRLAPVASFEEAIDAVAERPIHAR